MSNLNTLIDEYFIIKGRIQEAFGYVPDWVEIPMESHRDSYWFVTGENGYGDKCVWSDKPFTKKAIEDGHFYSDPIYTQRFLKKWFYKSDEGYTMVCVDTQVDGNKFLMIFDNEKQFKDQELIEYCRECW